MAQTLQEPTVRASTLLGMAVMDAFDAGATNGAIMLHDVPRALREQIKARMITAGWEAYDNCRAATGCAAPRILSRAPTSLCGWLGMSVAPSATAPASIR